MVKSMPFQPENVKTAKGNMVQINVRLSAQVPNVTFAVNLVTLPTVASKEAVAVVEVEALVEAVARVGLATPPRAHHQDAARL